MDILLEKRVSILQLPCPELCYQALERVSIEPGTPPAEEYAAYCRELLRPLVHNLEEYRNQEIEPALLPGIDASPSCSVENPRAIMIEMLLEELNARQISVKNKIDMPASGDGASFPEKLRAL